MIQSIEIFVTFFQISTFYDGLLAVMWLKITLLSYGSHICSNHNVFKYYDFLKLLSVKLSEKKFFKFFNSYPNKKSKFKPIIVLGVGIFFLCISIFAIMNFTINSENSDSKISEQMDSIAPTSDSPQTKQVNERFGNAISIMPDRVQPGVSEPILENYDDVQKPPK